MIRFFDGGMGSMLNLSAGELPEKLNITQPDRVFAVHKGYAEAGAEFITTNTFGANSLKYDNVAELVKAGVELARRAGRKVALDIGPTGKLLKPMGDLDFEKAVELFSEVVIAGRDGADVVIIETMSDTYELKAAVLAAKENCSLPVITSMIFDENGRLLTGGDVKTACAMLEGLGVDVIGLNCGLGPKQMIPLVKELRECTSLPILVMPNAGLPESVNGQTVYNVSPEEFAEDMLEIAGLGVSYLGGCCGTTPEHIREMITLCKDIPDSVPDRKNDTVATSYSTAVTIGKKPVVIGERINPTGKKLFKEALRNNDIDYVIKEGLSQQEKGAHILDVNVGLPEIDEVKMLSDAVYNLQSVLPLPLQLDSSDAKALEKAMRIYNGKPMVNSVNGKQASMKEIFPLVKKYGGVVVCLCLDE
ncbi:MAG: homocysteine S-methyltransferase family protein, partial [Eubacterium sp.]